MNRIEGFYPDEAELSEDFRVDFDSEGHPIDPTPQDPGDRLVEYPDYPDQL